MRAVDPAGGSRGGQGVVPAGSRNTVKRFEIGTLLQVEWYAEVKLLQAVSDLVKDFSPIPRVVVFLGLLSLLGGFVNLGFLFIGGAVAFLGGAIHYGGDGLFWWCHRPGHEWCDYHDYDGRRHFHVGESFVPFALCLTVSVGCALIGWFFMTVGRWPGAAPSN